MARGRTDTGANVGFEGELWKAADALRGSMDAAEFKHAPDLGFTARTVPEFEAAPDHCIDLHRSLARLCPLLRRRYRLRIPSQIIASTCTMASAAVMPSSIRTC